MTTTLEPSSARGRDDRGVTIIVVAIALLALLAVAAIAIDGGQAYANRRQMQNGADAGAMAGTRAVDKLRFPAVDGTQQTDGGIVWDAVHEARQNNGGNAVQCWFISSTKARLSADVCGSRATAATTWTSLQAPGNAKVAGVEVSQSGEKASLLAGVAGISKFSATAAAAATIQPYIGGAAAPFIICGDKTVPPFDGYDMLNPDGSFKPGLTAIGAIPLDLTLQGGGQSQNGGVPGCGTGASFDGKLDPAVTSIILGVQVKPDSGNGFNSQIRDAVVAAGLNPCPATGPFNNCGMLLPIANASNGGNGNSMLMTPVAWGVFKVNGNGTGNPKYEGTFVAAGATVADGLGGIGDVTLGQARVIKLVT